MRFGLSDEQELLQAMLREFAAKELPAPRLREIFDAGNGWDAALWRGAAGVGLQGLAVAERYGGAGLELLELALAFEVLGEAVLPGPFLGHALAALALSRGGSDAQRERWLPKFASGEAIGALAIAESGDIWEPGQWSAALDGGAVRGVKQFVDNFNVADRCLVVCRTAEASADSEGLSIFLVDTDSRGISQTPLVTIAKDKQSHVQFENVRVPKANLLGDLNGGWPIAERMLDRATVLLCAQMVGAARKDSDMAIEYSKGRVAFGRPIASFQSIQHLCADMAMWVDGCQLLTYEALWRLDEGAPAGVEVSQAKAFCNEKCEATVRSCQQIHGGIGFMMEFDVHLFFRRVSAWTMRLGTTYEHRSRIANALLESPGKVRLGFSVST